MASPGKLQKMQANQNVMSRRKLMTEKKVSKKANINIFNTEIKISHGLEKLMRDSSVEGAQAISGQGSLKKPIPASFRHGFGSLESEVQSMPDEFVSPMKSGIIKLPPVDHDKKGTVVAFKRPGLKVEIEGSQGDDNFPGLRTPKSN